MDNLAKNGGFIGTVLSAVGASMSISELQAIVSIVVTILGFLITIITTIVIPVVKKYIAAKKDGKITIEEVEEIVDTAKDGLEETKNKINENK